MFVDNPLILRSTEAENWLEQTLMFTNNAVFFKGHFENYPVLPAIAQLHYVAFIIKKYFCKNLPIINFEKVKFLKIILPDQKISLGLGRRNQCYFSFNFRDGKDLCSSGKVLLNERNYYENHSVL
jgi:3-hydroxymyristoyl/3-hydroxydecanoyl-(acyl carrier protein) dehydratase